MGLFDFTELVQQQEPQDPPRRKNIFGGLIDGTKNLVGKGKDQIDKLDQDHKIRDGAAQAGHVVGRVAKDAGQNLGNQAQDVAGSAKRELNGEGTPEDRQRLIGVGKLAAGVYLGGVPLVLGNEVLGGKGRGLNSIPTDAQSYKDIYGSAQRAITGQGTSADKSRLLDVGRNAAQIALPGNPLVKADAFLGRGLPQLRGETVYSSGDRGASRDGSVYSQVGETVLGNFDPQKYRAKLHANPGQLLGNSFPRLSNLSHDQIIEKASNIAGDKLAQVEQQASGAPTLLSGRQFDMSKVGQFAQVDGNKILKGLGGLIKGAVEDGTRVNTLEFVQKATENFDKLDFDKDGHISNADLKAVREDDPIFSVKNLHLMNVMDKDMDKLSNMSNDDWFSESKGITRGDLNALKQAKDGTGYGAIGSALSSAWDGKYAALVAGAGAGLYGSATSAVKLGRAGLAAGSVVLATGLYGSFDYYTSRKGNIEAMISELK